MPAAALPVDETERLAALTDSGLLAERVDSRISTVTRLAADLLERPSAALSLVDADRQVFRPAVGLPVGSTSRDVSFCAHAILQPSEPLIVQDARTDSRFFDNPLVTGNLGLRFYAGMPVRAPNGQPVGALCVLDSQPGTLSEGQVGILRGLAREIESAIRRDRPAQRAKHALGRELRQAIRNRHLAVARQPIARAGTLAVIGHEWLARWTLADGEAVPPDVFIPIAESSGIVGRIDRFVLETACAASAGDERLGRVSINVSATWFRQARPALPRLLGRTLQRTGLRPDRLVVEVTERMLIADPGRALEEMLQIKALGAGIALDDFGTGYSSLSYLEAFPFDIVKLDKAFVRGLGTNPRAEAIAGALIRLGRDLGMSICAEGVEEPHQLAYLQQQGCDLVQGYLIGHPRS